MHSLMFTFVKHIVLFVCFGFTAPMGWHMSYSSVKCISNNVSEIMSLLNKIIHEIAMSQTPLLVYYQLYLCQK